MQTYTGKKYGNLEGRTYIYMMNDFLKTFLLRYRKSFLKTAVAPEPPDQIYFILFFYQCARLIQVAILFKRTYYL